MNQLVRLVLLTYSFTPALLYAQSLSTFKEDVIPLESSETETTKWPLKLSLGTNLSQYENVVGQPDGMTTIYSLDLDTRWIYRRPQVERFVRLKLKEVYSRTPVLDALIKTEDDLELTAQYWRYLSEQRSLAAYARLNFQAPLFAGYDYQPTERTYVLKNLDGTQQQRTTDRLRLSYGLLPAVLKLGSGLGIRPIDESSLTVEARAGLGARRYLAAGQWRVEDTPKDPLEPILVEALQDRSQVGSEFFLGVSGTLFDNRLGYGVSSEVFWPLAVTPEPANNTDLSKLTSHETLAKLALNLTEWSALVYEFKNRKEPLLIPKSQTTQSLMFTVSFNSDDLLD